MDEGERGRRLYKAKYEISGKTMIQETVPLYTTFIYTRGKKRNATSVLVYVSYKRGKQSRFVFGGWVWNRVSSAVSHFKDT